MSKPDIEAARQLRAKNVRLALILASVALVFFVSFIANIAMHKA